jgi:hypothetical protein
MTHRQFFHADTQRTLLTIFMTVSMFVSLVPFRSFGQMDASDEETAFYRNNHYIPIKGEQDSDYPKGVYLVTNDVVIKKGKTMTFLPGTLVLFKKDTRITVEGRLICQGNPNGTITFGKLANEKYLIPLDPGVDARWDGIFVVDSGSVEIGFSYITGSKYGLEADRKAGNIVLDTVMFRDNKFQNLHVAGNDFNTPDNKFIFYSSIENGSRMPGGKGAASPRSISIGKNKNNGWLLPVRFGLGAAALGGCALYATEWFIAANYQKKSDNAKNDPAKQNDADKFLKKAETAATAGNIGLAVGIIGALGFGVTFLF